MKEKKKLMRNTTSHYEVVQEEKAGLINDIKRFLFKTMENSKKPINPHPIEIIDSISKSMSMSVKDTERFYTAVRICEYSECVRIQELRQLAEIGLPIVAIMSDALKIETTESIDMFQNKEISYRDLICALGMWFKKID